MKFGDLYLRNFLSIAEVKVNLADIGLVSIAGENVDDPSADSNGAGKSTMPDGLNWILWGKTARGVSGDDVINSAAGKDCCGSIDLIDGADTYRITRYRKAPKHKNALLAQRVEQDGTLTDLTKGKTDLTQALVAQILGCSEDVFLAAIYSGQEQMPDLPRKTDRELKLIVEEAAGIDVLNAAHEVARERLREAQQRLSDAQITRDRIEARHSSIKDAVQRSSAALTQWATDTRARVTELTEQAKELVAAASTVKAEIDIPGMEDLRTEITKVSGQIGAVNIERQKEQELAVVEATKARTLDQVDARCESLAAQVKSAKNVLDNVEGSVGQPCGECGKKKTPADIGPAKKLAEEKLREIVDIYQAAVAERSPAHAAHNDAAYELKKFRAGMTDVSAAQGQMTALQRELRMMEAKQIEFERLRQQAVDKANAAKQLAAQVNPHKGLLEQYDQELKELAAVIAEEDAKVAAAQLDSSYAAAVVEVFAPKGVRAHALDDVTPFLNDRTARYLGALSDGTIEAYWTTLTPSKDGKELKEQFSIAVERAGTAPSFNALSGGQKRKVRLACALALQDLVASRATKQISLFIGDEIDDALDSAGLERLMGILEEKARDRGSVLVISHNDIADYARTTWTARYENGVTEVLV